MPEQGTGGTGGARCTMVQPPARTSGTGTGAPRLPARWYTVRTRTVCAVVIHTYCMCNVQIVYLLHLELYVRGDLSDALSYRPLRAVSRLPVALATRPPPHR